RFVMVTLLALCGMTDAAVAPAETTGGGELGPDYVRATLADLGNGTFPGGGLPASQPGTVPAYVWSGSPMGLWCVAFVGGVPAELAAHVHPLGFLPVFVRGGALLAPIQGWPDGGVAFDDPSLVPPDAVDAGQLVVDIGIPAVAGPPPLAVPRCNGPVPAPA